MTRFLVVMCGAIAMTATAMVMAGTNAKPAGSLTAAQIIDKNVAARGGLEAWRAVGTLAMSGQMEAGGKKNSELPFVMRMKRPHMNRLEIRFKNQTAVQVYDGSHGWKIRPFLGRNDVEPFSEAEAKEAAAWEELDGPLVDYRSKGTQVMLEGKDSVEGRDAYKLKLTLKNGSERHLWVDAATFLELKIEGQPRKMDGKWHDVAIFLRDYKKEGGLMMPHEFETVVEGVREGHKMRIERVSVNPPLDNNLFTKPQPMLAQSTLVP